VSLEEQARVCKFYFIRDAKLSLASSLLKRLFVARTTGTPWKEVSYTRRGDETHGKPCCTLPLAQAKHAHLDFNVSHQAGLTALVGCNLSGVDVGIDITCVNEREKNDMRAIEEDGFEHWIDMHEEMFSPADLLNMKRSAKAANGELSGPLRTFYTYWCLKEAYIKMVGEGLLAKWLKDVEFRMVRCPQAVQAEREAQKWGELVTNVEVWVRGQRQDDVTLTLQAFEENYIFGTAVKQSRAVSKTRPDFIILNLETDVYPFSSHFL